MPDIEAGMRLSALALDKLSVLRFWIMKKTEALDLLGGTPAAVARAIGITPSAVSQWPDDLPPTIADRVQAALWRIAQANQKPAVVEGAAAKAA